jgi:hypothetical protein
VVQVLYLNRGNIKNSSDVCDHLISAATSYLILLQGSVFWSRKGK